MRDRLIELLDDLAVDDDWYSNRDIADYLLANGVIVPPCMVGDKVWLVFKIYSDVGGYEKYSIFAGEVFSVSSQPEGLCAYCRYEDGLDFWHKCVEDFGKIVFLTKEEAEKALAERGADND